MWASKMLIAVVLFHYFIIPSGVHNGSYFAHASQHIKTRLVFNAACTGTGTLPQANNYRPECSARIALYSEMMLMMMMLVWRY